MPEQTRRDRVSEQKTCEDCKFWIQSFEDGASDVGQCRRYPPTVVRAPTDMYNGHEIAKATTFPYVPYMYWCGEWVSKIRTRRAINQS